MFMLEGTDQSFEWPENCLNLLGILGPEIPIEAQLPRAVEGGRHPTTMANTVVWMGMGKRIAQVTERIGLQTQCLLEEVRVDASGAADL